MLISNVSKIFVLGILLIISSNLFSDELPFDLQINGDLFQINKKMVLSDPGEDNDKINFDFKNKKGEKYNFDLKFKKLPSNRSYPANLDITIKNAGGEKLGYLFWANNGVQGLKKIGVFGLIIDIEGKPMDVKFTFDKKDKGELFVKSLGKERFFSDTLIPKKGFQMIRPMLLPEIKKGVRSQSYALDAHPFEMNYTLKGIDNGLVQFQYNLYAKQGDKTHLLERIYYNAANLDALREGMFAGKYFDKEYGTFKLVFYPAMGQTSPPESP